MINRGPVPSPRPLPAPWRRGTPPRTGSYLAVDHWRTRTLAQWNEHTGWIIRGVWSKEGPRCWAEIPEMPSEERLSEFDA